MKYFAISLMLLFAISMTSCNDILIEDGQVPDSYLPLLQPLTGLYIGQMSVKDTLGRSSGKAKPISISISLLENRVFLQSNTDLAGTHCRSIIGDLRGLRAGNGHETVGSAWFDFDPNLCPKLRGRVLWVRLIKSPKNRRLQLQVQLHRTDEAIQARNNEVQYVRWDTLGSLNKIW